ncbi:MAG: hypothetical protein F6K41_03995 [Symploca sp. SIO3E6]|nr:hypothetical protein [Caldora sp. SIO3E6]
MGNREQRKAYFHHLMVKFFHRDCLLPSLRLLLAVLPFASWKRLTLP